MVDASRQTERSHCPASEILRVRTATRTRQDSNVWLSRLGIWSTTLTTVLKFQLVRKPLLYQSINDHIKFLACMRGTRAYCGFSIVVL